MRFRTTILLAGKTATGFRVPPEIVESLGASRRPPVRVTINGHTYRSTVASMGGEFMLGVSADNRELARVAAGDEVDVDVLSIEEARTPETRQRRIAKAVTALREAHPQR